MAGVSRGGCYIAILAVGLGAGRSGLAFERRAAGLRFATSSAARGPVGYLGVDVRDISDEQVSALKLRDAHGAEILRVDHDGPAGKIGLRPHDVVLMMNGQPVEGEEHVRRMLRELAPGRTLVLVISRDGQILTVTTQMANREEVERQAWEQHLTVPEPTYAAPPQPDPDQAFPAAAGTGAPARGSKGFFGSMLPLSPSYTGATLQILGPQLADFFGVPGGTGLLVRSIATNSPAAMAGLRAGDVVVRANAQRLASTADWTKALKESKGRPLTVIVVRDRRETTLTLTPDGKHRSSLETPIAPEQWACITEL